MRIEVIKKIERIEELKEAWTDLLEDSVSSDIFLSPSWFFSWWAVFRHGKKLYFLALWKDDRLNGLFPFYKTKKNLFSIVTFCGYPSLADRMDFILRKGFENECLQLFGKWIYSMKDWDLFLLRDFGNFNDNAGSLRDIIEKQGCKAILTRDEECYNIKTTGYDNFDDYRTKEVSRKTWKSFKNTRNRINREDGIEWEIVDHFDEGIFEEMSLLDVNKTLRGQNGLSFFNKQENKHFLKKLLTQHTSEDKGYLLFTCRNKGKLVSYILLFKYNNRLEAYQTATDKRFDRLSLGTHIILRGIDYAIKNNFEEFDFLKGGEEYKKKFSRSFRQNQRLLIYQKGFKSKLLYFYHDKIKPIRRRISENTFLMNKLPMKMRGKWDI